MAALHSALQALCPTPFSSVPSTEPEARLFLQDAFAKAQLIIDSVPPPSIEDSLAVTRSRSASNVSGSSEMSASSARADPLNPSHVSFQKEWGKPIKLAPKDNPLGMAVYKMAGKDGKGAWFARRSVHEGMGFKKWKLGLEKEFPESMEVQGGPGEGNIRGIGGERKVEQMEVKGLGRVEVYHLSAQFPGPTAPRDFVTLLITSSSALGDFSTPPSSAVEHSGNSQPPGTSLGPRHFMVISKPCIHPDCPPREGFIRGQYESIEFIREIPLKPKKTSSTTQLLSSRRARANSSSLDRKTRLRKAHEKLIREENDNLLTDNAQISAQISDTSPRNSLDAVRRRKRGRTISFAESRGLNAKGEAVDTCQDESDDLEETNPVEWIMVTRSDPGGSVPRFLVERGTPSGIVSDASKFLDWAFKKEHVEIGDGDAETKEGVRENGEIDRKEDELEAYQTNGHLSGLDTSNKPKIAPTDEPDDGGSQASLDHSQQGGILTNVANIAYAGIESYAPQIVINHLPGRHQEPSITRSIPGGSDTGLSADAQATSGHDEASFTISSPSSASFASAEDHFEDSFSRQSTASLSNPLQAKDSSGMSPHEKELAKLVERKRALDEKLARTREKELKDKEELTSREEERIRKAEEKHSRDVQKQEQKYKKEVAKLKAKRAKDAAKEEERKRKAEDKDEKARLTREKDELKQQLAVAAKENELLKEQVGALQRENTALVAKMGKIGEGPELLRDVRAEMDGGSRSRSSSLRKVKGGGSAAAMEGPVLAGEKKE